MDLGLADATAVVVGGGRGMGFAAARCLADDGARIAVVGRTQSLLDEAAEDLTACGEPRCARVGRRRHRRPSRSNGFSTSWASAGTVS